MSANRSPNTRYDTRSALAEMRSLLHDARRCRQLNRQTDQIAAALGCRPRILLVDLMSRPDRDLKYFMASALAQWGFDVDLGASGRPPVQTARVAIENSAHTVFLLVDDRGAGRRITAWVQAFKDTAGGDVMVCSLVPLNGINADEADVVILSAHALYDYVEQFLKRLAAEINPPRAPAYYIDGVHAGNRRIMAAAMAVIESDLPDHRPVAEDIVAALFPHSGNAIRIGISGVPGAGKSTFIERFGLLLIEQGCRVAVLAVDPSSQRTRGAVLGDKIRMPQLSEHENALIRPTSSSGVLGGVARCTRETMIVCEAAGYDVVLVETVGVGQSEIHVADMVDFFMVLLVAGAGDEFQGIKKGIIELADAVVITKADGDNIVPAAEARRDYEAALSIIQKGYTVWASPVLTCSAVTEQGIAEILQTILAHRSKIKAAGEFDRKRQAQAVGWMWTLLEESLKGRFYRCREIENRLPEVVAAVEAGHLTPTSAALRLLDAVFRFQSRSLVPAGEQKKWMLTTKS